MDVPFIETRIPRDEDIFNSDTESTDSGTANVTEAVIRPNIPFIIEHFRHEGRLAEDQVIKIANEAQNIFKKEPNTLNLSCPITSMNTFVP